MKILNLAVLASGEGTNLQAIIDATEKEEISAKVKVVISDNKLAYALERARAHNIPAIFVDIKEFPTKEYYEKKIVEYLKEYQVDLVILAGYMKIVGKELLNAYKWRIMNIHPALLPSFPGLEAWKQAIEYGVKVSGVTVHFVDEGVDTGPIILQEVVKVEEDDTAETLLQKIHQEEYKIYKKAIQLFAEGKLEIIGRRVKIKNG